MSELELNQTPTRTGKTEQAYEHRLTQFLHSVVEHLGKPIDYAVSPTDVADYFELKASTAWLPSTVRYNRAFLMPWLTQLQTKEPDSTSINEAILRIKKAQSHKNRKTAPKMTSSYKAKSISPDDLRQIIDHVKNSKSEWAERAVNFLQANIVTGLRPCEWETVQWLDHYTLMVQNAKATNGRANGPTRIAVIPEGDPLYQATSKHYQDLQAWIASGGTYAQYYENARKAIQRLNRTLWPNRTKRAYTLYTGRHQWAANEKAAGASKASIAEGMGHASETTAERHYGKARSGWRKGPAPSPTPEAPAPAPRETSWPGSQD